MFKLVLIPILTSFYYTLYIPPALTQKKNTFCIRNILTGFMRFSEQIAIISLSSINGVF
jgi:hypothetical protein